MVFKIALHLFVFVLLTVLSQVGGIVYLLALLICHRFHWRNRCHLLILFIELYLVSTFIIVPPIAKQFGRIQLPLMNEHVKPRSFIYPLLNRCYVKPRLKEVLLKVGGEMNKKYPDYKVNYLDGSFPFFEGFSLLPHLSHDDGEKLDVCFMYQGNGSLVSDTPTWLGYGSCENAKKGQTNMPEKCSKYWQYNLLCTLGTDEHEYDYYDRANKQLVEAFLRQKSIRKVFIEPHLKERLRLRSSKVRFHGCRAVRHDDHIHVQL